MFNLRKLKYTIKILLLHYVSFISHDTLASNLWPNNTTKISETCYIGPFQIVHSLSRMSFNEFFPLVYSYHLLKISSHLCETFIYCVLMDIMLILIKPSFHQERLYKDNKYNLFLVNINLVLTPWETVFCCQFQLIFYSDLHQG